MPVPRLALAAGVVLALSGALWLVGSVRWAPRAFDAGRGSSAVGAPPDVTRGRSRTASGAGPGDEAGPSADAPNAVGAEDFTGAELVVPATPDSRSAGHPRPFATARQEDYDRVGGVPPPELAVAPAPGAVEAGNAGPGADLADSGPGPDGAADAAVPVRAGTASAAPPTAAKGPDAQSARARPEGGMGEQAAAQATRIPQIAPLESPGEDRDLRWMVAAAAALLLLSAALFVRASSR